MSDNFYAGMIPFFPTTPVVGDSFLIYKIDSELGDGAVVPNLGSYTFGDDNMYLEDINSPNGQIIATSAAFIGFLSGPSADYYTILFRAGDIATIINAAQIAPPDGALVQVFGEGWLWGLFADGGVTVSPFQAYQSTFLLDDLSTSVDPDSNVVLMATINPSTGDFRVVIVGGGIVTDWTTLSPIFNPGATGFGSLRLERAFGSISGSYVGMWSQSYNGIAMWREECATDADFIRLYDVFVAAV